MALETEIRAYEKNYTELERVYNGKYVIFREEELVGAFDDLDAAAEEAISRFGKGPYLIRQVGAPPIVPPAWVLR
jgi:hypothetical protein